MTPAGATPRTYPPFLRELVRRARAELHARRIILFGSRARGDCAAASDYDLAIDAPEATDAAWTRFEVEVQEDPGTLLDVDIIRLDQADPELRERIEAEGETIYAE